MASSPFERQVAEADATEDRTSASSGMSDAPQQFEPSPSFLDHDRPDIRLVELPAWLQSFASSVGEPSEPEPELEALPDDDISLEVPVTTPDEPGEPDEPDAQAAKPEPRSSGSKGVGADFISEDDLPEWLRSIAPEETADTVADSFSFERAGGSDEIAVPTVSRAWSTSKDARGVDEATSLFALVASQTPQTALPDREAGGTHAGRAGAASPGEGLSRVAGYGSDRPPGEAPVIEHPATMDQPLADSSTQARLPILPLAVAGILLIVLIFAVAALFVL